MAATINFGLVEIERNFISMEMNGQIKHLPCKYGTGTVQSVIAEDKVASNLTAGLLNVSSFQESASKQSKLRYADLHVFLQKSENDGAALILFGKAIDIIYRSDRSISLEASADGLPINTKFGQFTLGHFDALPKEDFHNNPIIKSSIFLKSNLFCYSFVCLKALDFVGYHEGALNFKLELKNFALIINPRTGSDEGIEIESISKLNGVIQSQQKFADFVIKSSEGTEFGCHKAFLAAHSEMFEAILSTNMKETNSGVLVLEEMGSASVQALLDFLYTLKIDAAKNDAEIALDLLKSSHMYVIKSLLKSMTTLFLSWPECWKTDVDFAIRLFDFTSKVEALEGLKMKAVEVLKSKGRDTLMESESFKKFFKNNHDAMELYYCTIFCR